MLRGAAHQSSSLERLSAVEASSLLSDAPSPFLVAYLTRMAKTRRSLSSASGPGFEETLTTPTCDAFLPGLRDLLFCLSFSMLHTRSGGSLGRWPLVTGLVGWPPGADGSVRASDDSHVCPLPTG